MPRYFFHLRDGTDRLLDPQGRSIEDVRSIAAVALKEVRALIAADALQGTINLRQRLEVEDGNGAIVHIAPFTDAVRIVGGSD